MADLTPVDFDPFKDEATDGPKLEPVDGNPFTLEPVSGNPFAAEGEEPSVATKLLAGAASVTPVIGEAKNLIEQKLLSRPETTETREVSASDLPPTIDPVTGEADFGPTVTDTVTQEAVTEEDIRARQEAEKQARLRADFPTVIGTQYEDDVATRIGAGVRYVSDLITVPIPTTKAKALGDLVRTGKGVFSPAGRQALGAASREGAIGASVFGASDNAIRQLASTGEINAEELGTVALVSGAGGAVVAPAVATLGGKFVKWMNNRSKIEAAVTPEEVTAVSGGRMTREEAVATAEAMNEVQARKSVEAATIDALYPVSKSQRSITPGNVGKKPAKLKLTKAQKQLRDDIKAAIEEDGGFRERTADEIIFRRKVEEALPLEVRRAREALFRRAPNPSRVSNAHDEVLAAKIRARQDAELARLAAERTRPKSQPVATLVQEANKRDNAVIRDASQPRNSADRIPATYELGQKTAKRMEQIAPRVAGAVRRATAVANRRVGEQLERMKAFAEDPKIRKMVRKNDEFKAAVLNRDTAEMNRLLPGSGDKYADVARVVDEYAAELKASGRPVIDEGIHPRAVTNLNRLRKEIGHEDYSKVEKVLIDQRKAKKRDLTEHEIAAVVSQLVGGHELKQFRGRSVYQVTPRAARHYMDPVSSLYDYVHRLEEDRATKAFFKNALNADVELGKSLSADELQEHIGGVLARSLREGELSGRDVEDLAHLLDVHFGASRQGPSDLVRQVKDVFTASTLGWNPGSTATQIADIGIAAARFGPVNAVRGLFGQNVADLYVSGLRNAASDMRTQRGIAAVTKRSLKDLGFEKVDKIGNKTAMNAAFHMRARQARVAPQRFRDQLEPLFGKEDTQRMMDDIVAGRYTDDVATLMAHDVADIRPISREDMPLSWNEARNGRLAFSLLSWAINQFNFVRNTAVREIGAGTRSGDMKRVAAGVASLVSIGTLMGLGNVPAGTVKDLMYGRDLDPVSHFAAGAIPFGMTGKFALDALKSRTPEAVAGSFVPFIGIGASAAGGAVRSALSGDPTPLMKATPTTRSLYNLMTGEGLENVGGLAIHGLSALIPDADASVNKTSYLPEPLVQRTQEQREVEAAPVDPSGVQAPEGWTYLPPPERKDVDKETNTRLLRDARDILEVREGYSDKVYLDSEGKPTVGVGHLLTKEERKRFPVGSAIPAHVLDTWFERDSKKAFEAARRQAVDIGRLDMIPALTSVNFQLGTGWNKEHKRTWKLLKEGKWEEAAKEAADSRWYRQTPVRVSDLQNAILGRV